MKLTLIVIALVFLSAYASAAPIEQAPPRDFSRMSKVQSLIDDAIAKPTQQREKDPLKYITHDMTGVVIDLDHLKTDRPVQMKEERIVGDLETLIKKLEKACKSGSGGGSLNPTKPLQDSKIVGGPGGVFDLHDPKAGEKLWGQLPAKDRERILQSKTDGFPPGYESLLQSYYRRLAQEQTGDEKSAAAAPTTNPSGQ